MYVCMYSAYGSDNSEDDFLIPFSSRRLGEVQVGNDEEQERRCSEEQGRKHSENGFGIVQIRYI